MSQTKFFNTSERISPASTESQASASNSADLKTETTDSDSELIALGKQFEEIAGQVQKLHDSSSSEEHVEQIEAMLGRLEPIERAIMATPALTLLGLGVKARHAAYVMSEYWDSSIDRADWNARAMRLLIEAVCETAGAPLPFSGASKTSQYWPAAIDSSRLHAIRVVRRGISRQPPLSSCQIPSGCRRLFKALTRQAMTRASALTG